MSSTSSTSCGYRLLSSDFHSSRCYFLLEATTNARHGLLARYWQLTSFFAALSFAKCISGVWWFLNIPISSRTHGKHCRSCSTRNTVHPKRSHSLAPSGVPGLIFLKPGSPDSSMYATKLTVIKRVQKIKMTKSQYQISQNAARELECDESEVAYDAKLKITVE